MNREILHQDYVLLETLQSSASLELEYKLFCMLKPSIQKDGNQWCVLYGQDLQSGIAGFGDTPYLAVLDFNNQWHKTNNHE